MAEVRRVALCASVRLRLVSVQRGTMQDPNTKNPNPNPNPITLTLCLTLTLILAC